jgi:hypothetical protein
MLGHGLGVGSWGVDDRDPVPRCRRDVDDVEPGAVAPHHAELREGGEE